MNLIGADTETGGVNPAVHALLSIHACCEWAFPFAVYILPESQPGKVVQEEAARINGYAPGVWAGRGAVPITTAMEWFRDWLQVRQAERPDAVVVCHHLAFDKGFLEEGARVAGGITLPIRYNWRCSLLLLAELMDDGLIEAGKASLERLGELCGYWPVGGRPAVHEGGEDAEVCRRGYKYLKTIRRQAEAALSRLYTEGLKERQAADVLICGISDYLEEPLGSDPNPAPWCRQVTEWARRVRELGDAGNTDAAQGVPTKGGAA